MAMAVMAAPEHCQGIIIRPHRHSAIAWSLLETIMSHARAKQPYIR